MTMKMKMAMKPELVTIVFFTFLAVSSSAVDFQSDGVGQWSLVTKLNFSSQIRLHPHILILVAVPWSGESRSLMRDISSIVSDRRDEFDSLKLMFMYRNSEKMLSQAIGATDNEITILFYHHSVAYKYRGRLRAQSVLFSIRSQISVPPEDLPLKFLGNPSELKSFLDSTDKALIVLEFCGWASKLISEGTNGFEKQGLTSTRLTPMWMNMKEPEDTKMMCDIGNEVNTVPWLVDFNLVNRLEETGNKSSGFSLLCTQEEYKRFESFFVKLMAVSKDSFLPFERHRYGIISERSMLPTLGIREAGSWLAVLHFAGCPSCLKIIKKEDDLNDVMQIDNSVVSELEGDGRALEPILPANQPSMILFIDRSSDSVEIRSKSNKVLVQFRELALHVHNSYQVDEQQNGEKHEKLFQDQPLGSRSGPPRLKLSSAAHMIKLKQKMSTLVVLNEGKHVELDTVGSSLEGNSLHEIVSRVLQQKKVAKLRSLAKELGFQLLSDDIDIKLLVNKLPSDAESQAHSESPSEVKEDFESKAVDRVGHQSSNSEENSEEDGDEISQLPSESECSVSDHHFGINARDAKFEDTVHLHDDSSEHQIIEFSGFEGSFFFSDGNYRSLQFLTGESKIPRLVIVDPALEKHYAFPEEKDLNYHSMSDYLTRFLNGTLVPYIQSESNTQSPNDSVQSFSMNMDFHEIDSIPRLTSNSFSDLVVGVNKSDCGPWNTDVLVVFSNRWCGFSHRMEVVLREVYRAMRVYLRASKIGSADGESGLHGDIDTTKDNKQKLPSVYLLDCTLNDCSLILRSINQTEAYPSLVLFPAGKIKVIPYEGHVGVTDIIKFIANHGLNSQHLTRDSGILVSMGRNGERNENPPGSASPAENPDHANKKERFHEVLLANQAPKKAHIELSSRPPIASGSILIATEKLEDEHPFGKTKVLIVSADQVTGFQGLIFNKHIRWEALSELSEGLEILPEAPLSFGGPVIHREGPLVALTRGPVEENIPRVLSGICFLDQALTVDSIREVKSGNGSASDLWFFVGYSRWSWDQLYVEIADGAWEVSNNSFSHFAWP